MSGKFCQGCNKKLPDGWEYLLKKLPDGWEYLLCFDCCDSYRCQHGEKMHECDKCMVEADLAFDAEREAR